MSYIENTEKLSLIIQDFFGNKATMITPAIASEDSYPWFGVEFILYRTYKFTYEFEKGFFSVYSSDKSGISIEFSEGNQKKFNNKSLENADIMKNLKLLDEEVRLRLPDKFLVHFD